MIFTSADLDPVSNSRVLLFDGAFDPLHAGHLDYLTYAPEGYALHERIVSVASDDAIRAKGREPLLDQATRARVVESVRDVDGVILRTEPLEDLIARLKPAAYIKGKDWEGKLPQAQLDACQRHGVQIVYTDTVSDSSTGRLRQWALADADQGLDRLEAFIAGQSTGESLFEKFDTLYFQGDWRADGNAYTYEARKAIEGQHPQCIHDCFCGLSILDVGCGPGFLVRMLKALGMDAGGCDPSADAVALAADQTVVHIRVSDLPPKLADVVICREVLEHVPITEIAVMVADLFRVARRFCYITTRFSNGSVFDAATDFETDPTHISLLTQPFLRALCVLNGGKRRRDLETRLDHMNKGRVLVYEV